MIDQKYSPAEVCELFGIAKTTLFRWEQEDWFPRVGRDLSGQRQYSREHIQAIAGKQIEKLSKEYDRALRDEDMDRLQELHEAISKFKFLQDNRTGLSELREYSHVSDATSRLLLRSAWEQYSPHDRTWREIIKVVLDQSRELEPSG
jgi:hypothetical protein